MALMHVLIEARNIADIEAAVAHLETKSTGTDQEDRAEALVDLFTQKRDHIVELCKLLDDGIDHDHVSATAAEGVATCRALFDRLAQQSPEAAVALYSLGSPEILQACTDEIIGQLRAWGVISPSSDVLDLGCGIGRVAAALAPAVNSVVGLDLSAEMIGLARTRHGNVANLRFMTGSGESLAPFPAGCFDLVLAVDSFPYIVQCGLDLAARHVAEARRVLREGGNLVIFNFSYRGIQADREDMAQMAASYEFNLIRNGVACFTLWDGAAFWLQQRRKATDGRQGPALLG